MRQWSSVDPGRDTALSTSSAGLRAVALLAALLLGVAGAGCDLLQKEVAAPDSASPFVSLSVSPGTLPAGGGDVDLEATVTTPDGTPRPGLDVEFETSAGALEPADPVTTDEDGKARARLTTDQPAEVKARVEVGPFAIAESSMVSIGISEEEQVEPGEVSLEVEVTPEEAELREEVTFVVEALRGGERIGGDLEIDFGDGRSSREPEFGGRTRISHTFREVGRFRVVFTLSDSDGNQLAREGIRVPVTEPVKTIVRVSAPEEAEAESPVPVEITVEGEDGSNAEGRVSVDLGDGRSRQLGPVSGLHLLEVKYRDPGRYRIVAEVEDEDGVTHRDGTGVRIVPQVSYSSELSLSDSSPVERAPVTVTLDVSASDGSAAQGDVLFEFGDNRSSRSRDIRRSASVQHTWREPGTYILRATFEDERGRTTTSQRQVTVVEEDTGGGGGGDDGGGGGGGGGGGADAIDPSRVQIADSQAVNALAWPATQNVSFSAFRNGNQSWSPAPNWPGLALFGETDPSKFIAGNLWIIRRIGSSYQAAPMEWFWQGMTRQFLTNHLLGEPPRAWLGWSPAPGEQLWVFLSTPAWHGQWIHSNRQERTNIVAVTWGQ